MTNQCNNPNTRPSTFSKKTSLLEMIAEYVDVHLTQKITLKQVAAYCGVSVSTVTQLFQKHLGISFHHYLTRRRMAAAESLIGSDIPLEEVGKQIGYADHSTFYRAFRQSFGVSPREYRKIIQKKENSCHLMG